MIVIHKASIEKVAVDLIQNGGVATLYLPETLEKVFQNSFTTASDALDVASAFASNPITNDNDVSERICPIIEPNANSANATGYHSAGGENALSRYNAYRQGFIFSNGELFDIPLSNNENFETSMKEMFDSLSNVIAQQVIIGIAEHLQIDPGWFQDHFGSMDQSSQWHIKRFVLPKDDTDDEVEGTNLNENCHLEETNLDTDTKQKHSEMEWLPAHTDPSLISVVIHDAPGVQPGALGLEYQVPIRNSNNSTELGAVGKTTRVWKQVEAHGHAVATILSGSVLSYITGGYFPSAKHRVLYERDIFQNGVRKRQTATLFVRPKGDSILTIPPSHALEHRNVKIRQNCKFEDWLNKVSRNYQGAKNDKNKTQSQKKEHTLQNGRVSKNDMDPMYWADEYTELTLHGLGGGGFEGREKYLGGELCELDGHIYTIPGFAHRILDIDATQEPPKFQYIGPDLPGEFKWLRGIPIGDNIYGIPCHSDAVLKINVSTHDVQLLKWNDNDPKACPSNQKWKYHGAAVSDVDGCIYCIPQAAEYVMKINPITDEISFIGDCYPGVNKWYGGQLLPDGCIYGVCQNHRGILKIDPKTQETSIHGNFPEGGFKWHGAVQHPDGNFYCIPAHADQVLKIEPGNPPKLTLLGENLQSGKHRQDGKYKFLGGAVGGECVYFFPSDADFVCEVNTGTGTVRNVGPNLRDHESMFNNKWQNGFTAIDGTIYGIPLKGHSVLRIRRNEKTGEVDVNTIGGPYSGLNKWEGGVTARNGDMYCMPLNHKYSLRIRPIIKQSPEEKLGKMLQFSATLRSSCHTLKHSKSREQDIGPSVALAFPHGIRTKEIFQYDMNEYNLRDEVMRMLKELDANLVGDFQNQNTLESFHVPATALVPVKKTKDKSGTGEESQKTLSDRVATDERFLAAFDRFVCNVILPYFKERLVKNDLIKSMEENTTFWYQRPPTLRVQPGPSVRHVKAHHDASYGHQDGELNFWMPLTDPELTQTDLWLESEPGKEDYEPLGVKLGEIAAFHGSSCMHYVPANSTVYTRISLDFRVGVEEYFDPNWKMRGTISDHIRRKVVA